MASAMRAHILGADSMEVAVTLREMEESNFWQRLV
jgi:hypothetical protein